MTKLAIYLIATATIVAAQDADLSVSLRGLDWKRAATEIAIDPAFQSEVRAVFGSLTPQHQRSVSTAIVQMKEGRGYSITETPVDAVVAKALAVKLQSLVQNQAAKVALADIASSGSTDAIFAALSPQPSGVPSTTVQNASSSADFTDLKWVSRFNTMFIFKRDKSGIMERGGTMTTFKWSKKGPNIVTNTTPTYFFKFEKGTGLFGVRINEINQELKVKE